MSEESLETATLNRASKMLCEARESLGLSQKAVADQLFLTTTFIKYIDEGEFDRIPKPAFIKGYLRSYARVVQLDRDEVIACYEADIAVREQTIEIRDVTEENVGSSAITGPVLQTGLAGLGAVLLLVILVWVFSGSEEEPVAVVTTPLGDSDEPVMIDPGGVEFVPLAATGNTDGEAITDTAVPETVAGAAGETDTVEDIPGAGSDEANAAEDVVAVTLADNEADAAAGDVEGEVEVADADSDADVPSVAADETGEAKTPLSIERFEQDGNRYIILDAGGTDEMQLSFSDDCWVEIEDARGDALYGDLNRSGDVLRLYADTPVRVLFGKATVVTAELNGEMFDLGRFTTRDETAKVIFEN